MIFKVGDRVKLEPSSADGWFMPERKFAKEGRLATVTSIYTGEIGRGIDKGQVRILWDKGRKTARDIRGNFNEKYLVLVEEDAEK